MDTLNVQRRTVFGRNRVKKLRQQGLVPAILYGHKEENVPLAVPESELEAAVRHGARLVQLKGAVEQQALIREVQWDTWGNKILHVDFFRVTGHELIEVTVPIELRGEAAGLKDGGIVEQLLHEIDIECPATRVPERIIVNVSDLQLDGEITAAEVPLPEGAKLITPPEQVVVHCVLPLPEEEEAAEPAKEEEPEVIKKPEKEEEQEE